MPPIILINVMSRPAIASPRTNLDAPSIDPKKALSFSRFLRRVRASPSSIRPDDKSASIAICLPGMASRVKRAATSAIRPEPLVITTKFTITRIAKTIIPIMKLPCITKLPKASITFPAAAVPSCPSDRMSRVEARLSASRIIVAMSRMVGKDENSSGRWMKRAVMSTRTEKVIEIASEKSSMKAGIGRIRTTMIVRTPKARARSPRLPISANMPLRVSPPGEPNVPVLLVPTSLMTYPLCGSLS